MKEATLRLSFTGLLNNGRRDLGIIGEGIEPDKEARLRNLPPDHIGQTPER